MFCSASFGYKKVDFQYGICVTDLVVGFSACSLVKKIHQWTRRAKLNGTSPVTECEWYAYFMGYALVHYWKKICVEVHAS